MKEKETILFAGLNTARKLFSSEMIIFQNNFFKRDLYSFKCRFSIFREKHYEENVRTKLIFWLDSIWRSQNVSNRKKTIEMQCKSGFCDVGASV